MLYLKATNPLRKDDVKTLEIARDMLLLRRLAEHHRLNILRKFALSQTFRAIFSLANLTNLRVEIKFRHAFQAICT
jgi:hypothetical protein